MSAYCIIFICFALLFAHLDHMYVCNCSCDVKSMLTVLLCLPSISFHKVVNSLDRFLLSVMCKRYSSASFSHVFDHGGKAAQSTEDQYNMFISTTSNGSSHPAVRQNWMVCAYACVSMSLCLNMTSAADIVGLT